MKKEGHLSLSKISSMQEAPLNFSGKENWMQELLGEVSQEEKGLPGESSHISFVGTGVVKEGGELEKVCLIKGQLLIKFWTLCSHSGDPMLDTINAEINCAFLDENVATKFGYEEEIDLSFEEETYDLYFFDKRLIPIQEVFREYMNLERNPYPTLASE